MSDVALAPRAHALLSRLDAWADRGVGRAMVVKVSVTVAGPLVVLAGIAMLVLPGPGLVVIAGGLALLALEYEWARRVVGADGSHPAPGARGDHPQGGIRGAQDRRSHGDRGLAVAGFLATAAVTAFLGAHTVL